MKPLLLKLVLSTLLFLDFNYLYAQNELITNINARKTTSLNGKWQYIVDPYETGYYSYRWLERSENDREAYWNSDKPDNKTDRKEHGYSDKYTLNVPGDWNSQEEKFLYYEGTVWYKKSFDFVKSRAGNSVYLYFGAVNYQADVYLNGKKLGSHKGGFSPFNFRVADSILKEKNNFLVVKVDNRRKREEIPTLNTDWWNYGGITRDVLLVEIAPVFIRDYFMALKKNSTNEIEGWIKLNTSTNQNVSLEIPELKFKKQLSVKGDSIAFSYKLSNIQRWSPENPKLYDVKLTTNTNIIQDKVGFRTIEVQGSKLVLNGQQVFLRGICVHEEISPEGRRAYNKADAAKLFSQAKALNANMVRLAHYPHNENMVRMADSLGILVWSEIPVYWTIDFGSKEVLNKAKFQLKEMITRDRNRASVIIWSVGNETPVSSIRTTFMSNLISAAKQLDNSRLVSAALEVHNIKGTLVVDDPLGEFTDIVSVNEYLGW